MVNDNIKLLYLLLYENSYSACKVKQFLFNMQEKITFCWKKIQNALKRRKRNGRKQLVKTVSWLPQESFALLLPWTERNQQRYGRQ